MTKRVVAPVIGASPQFIADYYHAQITGLSDTYVDYYVTAMDTRGNTLTSPIQHVYVASNPGGTPTPTPTATPTPTPTPTSNPTPIPFTMDGQADSAGYLRFSNGMTIYAAVRNGILYLATWSPGNSGGANDHFIFITDQLLPAASAPAPWVKAGAVAVATNKPFIGGESSNNFANWSASNLPLQSGPNQIDAFAVDSAPNASLTNSIVFSHKVTPSADWAPDSLSGLILQGGFDPLAARRRDVREIAPSRDDTR